MKRSPYLVNNYLKVYMIPAVLTIAVLQINSTVDSILMGQFIGPAALSAINVSSPIISSIMAVVSLLASGAVILIGKAFGEMNNKVANDTAITVLLSVSVVGCFISIVSFFFVDMLSNTLCLGNSLYEYLRDYLQVILIGNVIFMLNSSMDLLTDVGGNPKIVTRSSIANCVTDRVVDIFLVGVLGFGIEGAAISTVLGALVSTAWMLKFMLSEKSPYNLSIRNVEYFKILLRNLKQGVPIMAASIGSILLMLVLNFFIQKTQGEAGMFVVSIVIVIMGTSMILAGGSTTAFSSIGSMLLGREDYISLRFLYNRCIAIAMSSTLVAILIIQVASESVARLFGATEPELIQLVADVLPIVSWFMIAMCLLSILAVAYQVLGKMILTLPAIGSLPIFTTIGFGCVTYIGDNNLVWYVFPIVGFTSLFITFALSEFVRRKSTDKLSVITLLPIVENVNDSLEISVRCDRYGVLDNISSVRRFLTNRAVKEDLIKDIVLCVEELSLNIVSYSGLIGDDFIDIGVVIKNDGIIKVHIQDNGKPFDPASYGVEGRKLGLTLLHNHCDSIEYQYSFGQNYTLLSWGIKK